MPYYSTTVSNDFDEYDPTPYGGGYDIYVIYGRPLEHSDKTCYPLRSNYNDEIDYDRPNFGQSYAQPNAYATEAMEGGHGSYGPGPAPPVVRPSRKQQPGYDRPQHEDQEVGSRPSYGSGGGARYSGYGKPDPPADEYESGYGRKQESDYGSGGAGYGDSYKYQDSAPPSESYAAGYGRRHEYQSPDQPSEIYGSGYDRRPGSDYGSGGGRFGGRTEYQSPDQPEVYGSGFGRTHGSDYGSGGDRFGGKTDYETPDQPTEDYGSGYGRRNESKYGSGETEYSEMGYKKPVDEFGSVYGRKHESYQGDSAYDELNSYGRSEESVYGSGYGRKNPDSYDTPPSYGGGHEESRGRSGRHGYGKEKEESMYQYDTNPSYERRRNDDEYGGGFRGDDDGSRQSYGYGEDESHGRKKHGGGDSDEERKGRRHNKHHSHHRNYDDE